MDKFHIALGPDSLALGWPDGDRQDYPFLWLRDNDPAGWHPETKERIADMLSLPETPVASAARMVDGGLEVTWADGPVSVFALDWLGQYRPGRRNPDAAGPDPIVWDASLGDVPRHDADAVLTDDAALLAWLRDTLRYGATVVEGLAQEEGAGLRLAERVGFLRQTNFGVSFQVRTKPDPNNLAYTSLGLPMHTDLPNQELPPGIQFLHCIANDATGGGSILADGIALAEALRERDPDSFRLLSTVAIPFRFHDTETDIRSRQTVINLDDLGHVHEIKWSSHLRDVFDMDPALMPGFYRAWRAFLTLTEDPAYRVTFRLKAGDCMVFDNRRVLHGREPFDGASGRRHLEGCYVDRGEFLSRIRVLSRAA
ncbi:DUF971 domain-containing protein [Rhodobacterales bacterium HKCCE3408]|nr:DUF971 domain-containing protein [Rhodobacterales bacterium HKCCE3408]